MTLRDNPMAFKKVSTYGLIGPFPVREGFLRGESRAGVRGRDDVV